MTYTVGKGWHPLVDEATTRLDKLGVKVINHFEKYGTLRFSTDIEPQEATIILNEIEDRSGHTCEFCGNPGDYVEHHGWIKTLCPTCYKAWIDKLQQISIEQYMEKHQFLEADKKKVRDFLKEHQAVTGYLTKDEIHFTDKFGTPGRASRSLIGIQDNFV